MKGVRGRRKALYSVTRPKIPPASQTTSRPASAVKSRPVTGDAPAVRRPHSAGASSNKPAVVRPVTSKPATVNNKAAQNVSKRAATSTVPCTTTSRLRLTGQSAATKKPATSTQSSVVDSALKQQRRADAVRAANSRSTASRPSPSSQPSAAAGFDDTAGLFALTPLADDALQRSLLPG